MVNPGQRKQEERLVRLGVITSTHGVRGQVKIHSFTAYPQDMTSYGELCDKSGKTYRISITSSNKDILIATIDGVTERDAAERLRNTELFVARAALPETDANEYYHEDLIGLPIVTADNQPYGKVKAIRNFGAGDIIEALLPSGGETFLPFNKATFPVIDIKNGKLVVSLPEAIE